MPIQTILVPKKYGMTRAEKIVRSLGGKVKKVDIAANYYRFRQVPPRKDALYFTRESKPSGVKVVIMGTRASKGRTSKGRTSKGRSRR